MKAAFIPPIPELDAYGHGKFHLLLSHLLRDERYATHYEGQRKKGAYLVLDNSAHEHGEGDDAEMLMFNCLAVNAQEVVLPDVLDDADLTLERTMSTLETWFEDRYAAIKRSSPAFMYVPQGKDEKAWADCLTQQVQMHQFVARRYTYREDFVIGLSKDYESWDGGLMHLIDDYLLPLRNAFKNKMQVHLLGWGRALWELPKIAVKHPWIRSTDSAKPFVYGRRNIDLESAWAQGTIPKYPTRPQNYFLTSFTARQKNLVTKNCLLFQRLASGNFVAA